MNTVLQDIRYAIRSLRHSPGFATVAILTLGLGIGANTAIFSVVRGVLLKPLPHREGDRLVYLRHSADGPGRANLAFSVPEVKDFRAGAASLGGIAEYSESNGILQGSDGAVRVPIGLVTGNFFEVMGLSPILGRLTQPEDDGPGVPPVMVLTRGFWLSRFGGDSTIVGKQVRLDGQSVTVIGVVQEAPAFPRPGGSPAQHGLQLAPSECVHGAGPNPSDDRDGRPARSGRHVATGPGRSGRGVWPDAT